MQSLLKKIQESNDWCVDEIPDIINFKQKNDMKNLVVVGKWNHLNGHIKNKDQIYLHRRKRSSIYIIQNNQIVIKFRTGSLSKVFYSKYINKIFILISDYSLTLRVLIFAIDLSQTLENPWWLQEKGLGKLIQSTIVPWNNIKLIYSSKNQIENSSSWFGKADFQDFGFTSFNKSMKIWAIYCESGIFGKKIGLFWPVTLNPLQQISIFSFSDTIRGFMDWKLNTLHIFSMLSGLSLSFSNKLGFRIIRKNSTSNRIPHNLIIVNGMTIFLDWCYMIVWDQKTLQEITRVRLSYYQPNWLSINVYDYFRFPNIWKKLSTILKNACRICNLGDANARKHWPVIDLDNHPLTKIHR